jgi:hypothetical protein
MTKERPILFSAAMVRAILDGRKTQTRRVLKQAIGPSLSVDSDEIGIAKLSWLHGAGPGYAVEETVKRVPCPYGQPGDRLWVRETWAQPAASDPGLTVYRANYPSCVPAGFENIPPTESITGKPSIHMPRAACRIVLEVTGVRVERLKDCSEDDAEAEGIAFLREVPDVDETLTARQLYECLWDSINGASAWEANPWVWMVEFRRA